MSICTYPIKLNAVIPSFPKDLPDDLRELLDQVETDPAEYHGRTDDMRRMAKELNSRHYLSAEIVARDIIARQSTARQYGTLFDGLPQDLRDLVDKVYAGCVEFDGRDETMRRMEKYVTTGEFIMAGIVAEQVITQQDNLRNTLKKALTQDAPNVEQDVVELLDNFRLGIGDGIITPPRQPEAAPASAEAAPTSTRMEMYFFDVPFDACQERDPFAREQYAIRTANEVAAADDLTIDRIETLHGPRFFGLFGTRQTGLRVWYWVERQH